MQTCKESNNKDDILFFVFVFQFLILLLWTCKESNSKDERVGGRVDQAERELAVQNRGQGGVGRAVPGGRHGDCANARLGFNGHFDHACY